MATERQIKETIERAEREDFSDLIDANDEMEIMKLKFSALAQEVDEIRKIQQQWLDANQKPHSEVSL